MRRFRALLAASLVVAALGGSAVTPTLGASPDTVRVALAADPQSFDPMAVSDGLSQNILRNVFDALVAADDDLDQVGALATSWEFVAPSSWDFHLREGVTFHNGDPLTAEDVKFSYDRVKDEANNSPMAAFISDITSVDVIDPHTVRITTATPSAILPERTKQISIVPKRVVEEMGAEAFAKAPVGTGPYKLVDWRPNEQATLVANEDYWGTPPPIKNLVLMPIPEPATRVAALQTDQVDLIWDIPPSFLGQLQGDANLKVVNKPESRTAEVILNTNQADGFEPFKDRRVREAVASAIDYDSIITNILGGLAQRNCNPVPPIFFGYDASIDCPTYDPDHAKALLAEAGYPDGFDVTFGGTSGVQPNDKEIEEAIAAMLGQVGINVTLETPEVGVWLDNYRARHWPMVYHTNGDVLLDADQVFGLFFHSGGRKYYTTPEMDAMVEASRAEFDPAKRLPLVQEAIRTFVDDRAWISLWNEPKIWAMNSKLDFEPRGDEWTVMNRASWESGG